MFSKSKESAKVLPRIQSQKRVHTALEKKDSIREPLQDKNPSDNRQLKRTLSATNACKAVKYQNTGLIYAKKIQQLEKQSSLLDKQLIKAQQEITEMKKINAKNSKIDSQKDAFITQASIETDSKISSRAIVNINDQKQLANQIKKTQTKIALNRKKIDEQIERNKKIRKQVDNVRKQINTLKNLNKSLQVNLQKTTQQYEQLNSMSKLLDEQISNKNGQMHKVKIQKQHKKSQIIKNYDQILKYLEKELEKQKKDKNRNKTITQNETQVLYFTEFANKDQNNKKQVNILLKDFISDKNIRHSQLRKSKLNIGSQITTIRSKLDSIEKQFQSVKNQTGTRTTEEAIKQFYKKYEHNFSFYKYTNELYKQLEEQTKQNKQLQATKDRLFEQATIKNSEVKTEEIQRVKLSLQIVRRQKNKYSSFCEDYQGIFSDIRTCVKDYYQKLMIRNQLNINDLNQENAIEYLYAIKNICADLDNKFEEDNNHYHNIQREGMGQMQLNQMLEMVKKQSTSQSTQLKSERLMSREQFMRVKDSIVKRKQSTRKPSTSKK